MTDNKELAHRLLDFLMEHPERKFKRQELWQEAFCDDPAALGLDDDTQRRVIGRARELTLAGSYITHAVAANGFTYTYTKESHKGLDPMYHYVKVTRGQNEVLDGITAFVRELKGTVTPETRAEIDLIVRAAERAKRFAQEANDQLKELADYGIILSRTKRKSNDIV